jgi:hypothetical protein
MKVRFEHIWVKENLESIKKFNEKGSRRGFN